MTADSLPTTAFNAENVKHAGRHVQVTNHETADVPPTKPEELTQLTWQMSQSRCFSLCLPATVRSWHCALKTFFSFLFLTCF